MDQLRPESREGVMLAERDRSGRDLVGRHILGKTDMGDLGRVHMLQEGEMGRWVETEAEILAELDCRLGSGGEERDYQMADMGEAMEIEEEEGEATDFLAPYNLH